MSRESRFVNNDSKKQHIGWLIVQASAARQLYPVSGATVTVTQQTPTGSITLHTELTDISGLTSPMALGGIPESHTLTPTSDFEPIGNMYIYDVTVSHPYYVTMMYYNLPIYEGIKSVQSVNLFPKAVSPSPDAPIMVNEQQPNI